MKPSTVSVIIPTYNRAKVICRAVESALGQTYPAVEIVVVDDGSTDNTLEMLKKYGERIRLICQPNGGAGAARNAGLRVATGDYVDFLDSDDYFLPTKLEEQVAYLDENPQIDIALCGLRHISADDESVCDEYIQSPVDNILNELLWKSIYGLFPPHIALLRRRCFEKVEGFDTSLAMREEQDLWLRMTLSGFRFGMVEKVLCVYVDSKNSKGKNIDRLEESMMIILNKVFNHPGIPAASAGLRDEIYARCYVQLCVRLCNQSEATNSQKLQYAHDAMLKSLRICPDIAGWRKDTMDPWLYLLISIDPLNPTAMLISLLGENFNAKLRSQLLSRLCVILAFQEYDRKNKLGVISFVFKGCQENPGILKDRGVRSILVRSLIPTPVHQN